MLCSLARRTAATLLIVIGLIQPVAGYKTQTIAAEDAPDHIGEFAKVCGDVAQVVFRESSRSRPTFINFERDYPEQPFYAVVFGPDREKFGENALEALQGNPACVIGRVELYRGRAQIVVEQPGQIQR